MMLAVRLYKDVSDAPKGMPKDWPAEIRELGETLQLMQGEILMTVDEYNAYRDEHSAKYNAYIQGHDPEGRWRSGKMPHHYVKRAWRKITGRL